MLQFIEYRSKVTKRSLVTQVLQNAVCKTIKPNLKSAIILIQQPILFIIKFLNYTNLALPKLFNKVAY